MTENDKKLIEAAKFLQEHCKESCPGKPCLFSSIVKNRCAGTDYCMMEDAPRNWNIPEPSRWTDADIALAKALMAFGATKITRLLYEDSVVYDGKSGVFSCNNCVPYDAFEELNQDETVYLEDIVAEGENYG